MANLSPELTDPIFIATHQFAPSLPVWCLAPVALMSAILSYLMTRRAGSSAARFLVFAFTLRYILAAFQEWTFKSSPLGLSWNALGSLIVVILGICVIRKDGLRLKAMFPVYIMLVISTSSAALNGQWSDYLSAATKLLLLLVVTVATFDAFDDIGERLAPLILTCFFTPLACFLLSIVTHTAKAAESDGSTSYIGGFAHEAPFSMIIATSIIIVALSRVIRRPVANILIILLLGVVLVANYRTTILALSPLIIYQITSGAIGSVVRRQRSFVAMVLITALFGSIVGISLHGESRFADLARVAEIPELITKPTSSLNREDRQMFSGRIYLWNMNVNGFMNGPEYGYIIGAGPEVRAPGALIYPHNTLVAALYETGICGALATLIIWWVMLKVSFRLCGWERYKLIAAHLSFFILNMATMPFWYVEGLLMYGYLCGYTLYRSHIVSRDRRDCSGSSGYATTG